MMKATRINISKRQISNGRSSLYLDYYPGVFDRIKKRMVRHETLYLYVYDRPKTVADRQHNDEMMEIARQIRTKKTGAVSHHPVSAEAMEACGPVGDGLIFKGLTLNMTTISFKKWVADAGISKPVTFHTLRHTYATLLHENGNSLYTIQNLMIHLHPGTTAQYICNSDALARKAFDNLHLQPSRIKRIWSKVRKVFSGVTHKV